MERVSTLGEIRRGKLRVKRADRFSAQLARWRDCPVEITVARQRATRSQQQNAYYWGVVLDLLAEHTGYHVNELHEYFKQTFLPKHLIFAAPSGEVLREAVVGQTTTTLNKLEFGDYVERIRQVAAEMGVDIPDPAP